VAVRSQPGTFLSSLQSASLSIVSLRRYNNKSFQEALEANDRSASQEVPAFYEAFNIHTQDPATGLRPEAYSQN
jgi:hypothetical protein